jgi:exosortase A-associated hydrolase 1
MGTVMRRRLSFTLEGAQCAASLDEAAGSTGLLIVSGGNEILSGAHRGMAWLAGEVAAAGHPVLRFDRRGVGDSEGENGGFDTSGPDIRSALALFRAECPGLRRIVAFGNCDAATALLLHHEANGVGSGPDALLLANPWTIDAVEEADDSPALPPPSAIRARYLSKLKDPREWLRLLRGGVNLGKLARGLKSASKSAPPSGLAERMRVAMGRVSVPITVLLAARDTTALAFAGHWRTTFDAERDNIGLETIDSASHGFADDAARAWLLARVLEGLAREV